MLRISYDTGCRKCLQSEGIRSMYVVNGASLSDYTKRTEYQVMRQVEDWRKEDKHVCNLCGSSNVEITNVQADSYELYNYENLVSRARGSGEEMFMLNIDKREHGLDINEGGKINPDIDFIADCFRKLIETISQIPVEKFVPHTKGNFFVCLTGIYGHENEKFNVSIERLRFHGVAKNDIVSSINKMLLRYGISEFSMKTESAPSSKNEFELNFVFESSDHLRFESGRLVSGPHGGAPRAIKVESNIHGGQGHTVTMFNIDNGQIVVQMAPKQMKIIDIDSKKIVLRGYGHDSYGASFADYGLTIYRDDAQIEKIVLHMHDRNTDIQYLP